MKEKMLFLAGSLLLFVVGTWLTVIRSTSHFEKTDLTL